MLLLALLVNFEPHVAFISFGTASFQFNFYTLYKIRFIVYSFICDGLLASDVTSFSPGKLDDRDKPSNFYYDLLKDLSFPITISNMVLGKVIGEA